MPSLLQFGIACYHFGYHPKSPEEATGASYLEALNGAISSLPNITDISIVADESFKEIQIESTLGKLREGNSFFPCPATDLEIAFTIIIPRRLHTEIVRSKASDVIPERFRVCIHYCYDFPITFIRTLDPVADFDPSDGVIICREFIRDEFKKRDDSEITFECLGPSPFHAQFRLEEQETEDTSFVFKCERIKQFGYDVVEIKYSSSVFESIEDAWEGLRFELQAYFDLFYRIVHTELLQSTSWCDLSERMHSLIQGQQKTGISSSWSRIFRSSNEIHAAIIGLLEFESALLLQSSQLKKAIMSDAPSETAPVLIEFIKEKFAEMPIYPFQQARDILALLEKKSSKRLDSVIVLVAAILGGMFGSLITIMWQK